MKIGKPKKIVRLLLVLSLLIAASMQVPAQSPLYVYSTIDALLAGAYDGDLTIGQLKTKGDFAIGTFNHLDGEMIAVDGVFYHAKADGSVAIAAATDRTPLAYATHFHPQRTLHPQGGLKLAEVEKWLDAQNGNPNLFYAVRIEGVFTEVSVRAIAPQSKPYKPMAEIVGTQSIHQYGSVHGTLIGLRSPGFSKGISVPGYHWHFLTADRQHGGHVLAITLAEGAVQLQSMDKVSLELPRSEGFARADQSKDRTRETKLVEGK